MLRFFRSNSSNNLFLLVAYAILLQLHTWISPGSLGEIAEMGAANVAASGSLVARDLFSWLYSWMSPAGWLSRVLALLLVISQALHFARTVQLYKVVVPANWLIALFYVLFASFLPAFQYLSPELLAVTLVLIAFRLLFSTYYEDAADGFIFDAGLLVGLIALLYPPYALLLVFALLSLMIVRPLRFREAMVFMAGFLLPWFLSGVGYLMWDRLPEFMSSMMAIPGEIFLVQLSFSLSEIILLVIAGLLLLCAFLIGQFKMINSLIHSRKFQQMVLILLLVALLSTLLLAAPRIEPLIIFALPLSYFTTYLVNNFAWHRSVEGAHLLIVLLVLSSQFSLLG